MEQSTSTLPTSAATTSAFATSLSAFTTSVFSWMTVGLLITAGAAYLIGTNVSLMLFLFTNPWILIGSVILQLVLVITISAAINRLSSFMAATLFIIYALVNGIMLSAIFLAYNPTTIAIAVGATALTFTAMAVYGATTKADLTRWGSLALMGLIGVIIASIINIFLQSEGFTWILTYVSLGIFIVLTAYDVQKIKQYHAASEQTGKKSLAISAALALYLDFINLLLLILRIMGGRRG